MAEAALPVVECCRKALEVGSSWLSNVNRPDSCVETHLERLEEASASLQSALDDFKMGRLQILMPFRHLFDPNHPPVDLTNKVCEVSDESVLLVDVQMSYRGLFQNFVAEYHVVSLLHQF